jgi:hypothetical protein
MDLPPKNPQNDDDVDEEDEEDDDEEEEEPAVIREPDECYLMSVIVRLTDSCRTLCLPLRAIRRLCEKQVRRTARLPLEIDEPISDRHRRSIA